MGFQNLNANLHSFCGYQHLGNEDLVVFEFLTNNAHSVDHTFVQDLNGIASLIQSSR